MGSKRGQVQAGYQVPEVTDAVLEHIEQTLAGFRGMTDAALGGIAGVIGDALAQYESVMEQISRIRLDALHQTREIEQKIQSAATSTEIAALQTQIREISLQTERDIAQLARRSAIPIPEQQRRLAEDTPLTKTFSCDCPNCKRENSFQMPDRVGETRVVRCAHCQTTFNAHLALGGRVIARPLGRILPASRGEDSVRAEILNHLRGTRAYVEPSQLAAMLRSMMSLDASIQNEGGPRSPRRLQELVLRSVDAGDLTASKGTVRVVFALLYKAGAFEFPPGATHTFSAPFVNTLDERLLYEAYVRSSLRRLNRVMSVRAAMADDLSAMLLPESLPDRKKLLADALVWVAAEMERASLEASIPIPPGSAPRNVGS